MSTTHKNRQSGTAILAMFALLVLVGGANARTSPAPLPPAVACLSKPAEPLKYPEAAIERRIGGVVKVRLNFSRADAAPEIELLSFSGSSELVDAAKDYLSRYRLPCLVAGESVTLEQDLAFTAVGVEGEPPKNPAVNSATSACLRTPGPVVDFQDEKLRVPEGRPRRANVVLRLRFVAPDAPPTVEVLYASGGRAYEAAVLNHVEHYRLPCLKPGNEATLVRVFQYRSPRPAADFVLRDMGLVTLLSVAKDVAKVPVKFDLGGLSCPFQVRWTLYQPVAANLVEELGSPMPERKPLLAWLSTLALDLNKDQFEAVLGSTVVVDVPCGKIEL